MSKTGHIKISTLTLIEKDVFDDLIYHLMSFGWGINNREGFSYMIDGTFDYDFSESKNFETILSQIKKSIDNNKETSIELSWNTTSIGIAIMYLNSNTLLISCTNDCQKIASGSIVDFSWYLDKLEPLFNVVDYSRIVCTYD